MKFSAKEYDALTGKAPRSAPVSDTDKLVAALRALADAMASNLSQPVSPKVEVTVPPANVTVEAPQPSRPCGYEFRIKHDSDGRIKSMIATPL